MSKQLHKKQSEIRNVTNTMGNMLHKLCLFKIHLIHSFNLIFINLKNDLIVIYLLFLRLPVKKKMLK